MALLKHKKITRADYLLLDQELREDPNTEWTIEESDGSFIRAIGDTPIHPSPHTHGNISDDGKVGSVPNLMLKTGIDGVVEALAQGVSGQYLKYDGSWDTPPNEDTKNTAGTTDKASTKLFLAGAESQGANPQTYSNSKVYIGTDDKLYSNGSAVSTNASELPYDDDDTALGATDTQGAIEKVVEILGDIDEFLDTANDALDEILGV